MYQFDPAAQLHTGTIFHGPAPAPERITVPAVHDLTDDIDAYGATQTDSAIQTGDVLIANGVVGVMVAAWPIALHGDASRTGFHELSDDTDPTCVGQQGWGRLQDMRYFPVDGPAEGLPMTDYSAPRGGYDLTESFELAATIAASR